MAKVVGISSHWASPMGSPDLAGGEGSLEGSTLANGGKGDRDIILGKAITYRYGVLWGLL
jgi:hypothetical protein